MPVPHWMTWMGVWVDRTVGSLPLAAPLAVSGWYTFHVGRDDLRMPWAFALALTLALEGGAWKLARLYEKRLVAGLSTLAERFGLFAVLGAISGLIYWHATEVSKLVEKGLVKTSVTSDWRPAAVVAAMSVLAVFIWGREARWQRRHELAAAGLVDMQALRIGVWSWLVSPWESAWSFRHGMKYRIPVPADAVRDWRLWKANGKPTLWPPALPSTNLGPDGMPVVVPTWILDEITGMSAGTGTGAHSVPAGLSVPAVRTTRPVPVPTSPAPFGTANGTGVGLNGSGAGTSTSTGTAGTNIASVGSGGTGAVTTPTAGTAKPAGSGTDEWPDSDPADIAAYRERHRERLITVREKLGTAPDDEPGWDWRTIPDRAVTLDRICAAGGFKKRDYASEIKYVLMYDRVRMGSALTP